MTSPANHRQQLSGNEFFLEGGIYGLKIQNTFHSFDSQLGLILCE